MSLEKFSSLAPSFPMPRQMNPHCNSGSLVSWSINSPRLWAFSNKCLIATDSAEPAKSDKVWVILVNSQAEWQSATAQVNATFFRRTRKDFFIETSDAVYGSILERSDLIDARASSGPADYRVLEKRGSATRMLARKGLWPRTRLISFNEFWFEQKRTQ